MRTKGTTRFPPMLQQKADSPPPPPPAGKMRNLKQLAPFDGVYILARFCSQQSSWATRMEDGLPSNVLDDKGKEREKRVDSNAMHYS